MSHTPLRLHPLGRAARVPRGSVRIVAETATLTGGNRNEVTQLIPLLQALPPV